MRVDLPSPSGPGGVPGMPGWLPGDPQGNPTEPKDTRTYPTTLALRLELRGWKERRAEHGSFQHIVPDAWNEQARHN